MFKLFYTICRFQEEKVKILLIIQPFSEQGSGPNMGALERTVFEG